MPARRQIVSTYEPPRLESFDQQFWPIFMAMCITATILAGTIVTLLAGFWMWVSLMVLPAAVATLLLVLRFVDDRRIRRSLQLAVILSFAAHCLFLIFAQQTNIFEGLFVQVTRVTVPVQQTRIINISQRTVQQPWKEVNPTPMVTPEMPQPEKIATVETAVAKTQPTPVESQRPTESPQLVQRQQTSQTVPRLGQSLSQLHSQSQNVLPRSSELVEPSAPAPVATTKPADRPTPSKTEIIRESPASAAEQPRRNSSEATKVAASDSTPRRVENQSRPNTDVPDPSTRQPNTTTTTTAPKIADNAPVPPATSPTRPTNPVDSKPKLVETPVERQKPAAVADRQVRNENQPRNRPTESVAQPTPRNSQTLPAIDRTITESRPRRSNNSAVQPTAPTRNESPAPTAEIANSSEPTRLKPQAMSIDKSANGTAGVGRAANLDRELGSTQSAAQKPTNSLNRRERTTSQPDASSLTLQQAAEIPVASAAAVTPTASLQPDSVAVAIRSASTNRSELSASSSASLTQSDSQATRAETSVEKGTGSVDMGSTRIVTEIAGQRVEGGGQPEINIQLSEQPVAQTAGGGSTTPSIATDIEGPSVADNRSGSSKSKAADRPSPLADSSLNAQPDRFQTESGEPDRDRADDVAIEATPGEPGDSTMARNEGDEDDEEELQRQLQEIANRSGEGSSMAIESNAEPNITGSSVGTTPSPATASTTPSSRVGRAANLADDSSLKANNGRSSAQKQSDSRSRDTASTAQPGDSTGPRQSSNNRSDVGNSTSVAEAPSDSVSGGAQPVINQPVAAVPGQVAGATGQSRQINNASNLSELDRDAPAGMALNLESKPGPAGVGDLPEPDAGMDSRLASRESPAMQSMSETRFRKTESGGTPSISSAPTIAKEAFRTRGQPRPANSAPQTEESIELGLAFLARYQQNDGSWTLGGFDLDNNDRAKLMASDTAATGLALLAFQGAGYHHREFRYAARMQQAVDWLIENQKPTGEFYIEADTDSNNFARLYSHAIATLALTEAYGMTQDETLRAPVQRALDYVAATQDLRLGGWRYQPGNGSDTSVTGWMVMALQSARLAGLEIDPRALENSRKWMDSAQDASLAHLYRYNPSAKDSEEVRRAHGRVASPCMTAVGLLMRLYIDWEKTDPRFNDGAVYLLQHLPNDATIENRDTYYWYYGTQILRHIGGDAWTRWHAALHPLLVSTQIKSGEMAGSWDPLKPVPDRWGAHGGRLYVTTMNLLSLEVDYRLLPLYVETK